MFSGRRFVIRSDCTFFSTISCKNFPLPKAESRNSRTQILRKGGGSDLLVPTGGRALVELTFEERRMRLKDFFVKNLAMIRSCSPHRQASGHPLSIGQPRPHGEDQKPAQHRLNLSASRSHRSFQDASAQLSPCPLRALYRRTHCSVAKIS